MNRLWGKSSSRDRKPYDRENLKRAFDATLSGMSVYRASRVYCVPESTLRDRTRNNVTLDCKMGPETLFSKTEEDKLAEHIKYMANIGYGYTMTNIRYLAADYSRSLGKEVKAKDGLSTVWFYAFLRRHPDLKNVQPQKLDLSRAKGASQEKIDNYFNELRGILSDNGLLNHPERIFNIDETGISTQHTPPNIVCGRETKPQAVTSPKSSNVTIIGGANALGNFVPPFYVFPGKRWNEKFIEGAPQGADGAMSDSGWSNSEIFETYVIEHLAKHASLNTSIDTPATLILYDGHRSHISLTLTEWAKKRNVVLFVLPPHTSHLTQPLDVGVFGPLKSYYYSECQQYLQKNPGISITKYEVAHLTSRPYLKAFCPENIISAFRKSGIYPFDDRCISVGDTAPASIYPKDQSATCAVNDEVEAPEVIREPENSGDNRESNSSQSAAKGEPLHVSSSFFESKTITSVKQRPKKHFKPPYICGNLSNETNMGILQNQTSSRKTKPINETKKSTKCKNDGQSKVKKQKSPQPSTSGTSKSGGPINLETPIFTDESDSDSEVDDGDKCCVCNMWSPTELKGCTSITFVKWGKCDFCPHWVHLKYCTAVKVLRRASIFRCPHCTLEE